MIYIIILRAGSSRSGTFIAVWQLMDAVDRGETPDVFSVVQRIRDQRAQAVNKPVSLPTNLLSFLFVIQ